MDVNYVGKKIQQRVWCAAQLDKWPVVPIVWWRILTTGEL